MAQWIKALAALGEDLGLVPNTHMVDCSQPNSSCRGFNAPLWPPGEPERGVQT